MDNTSLQVNTSEQQGFLSMAEGAQLMLITADTMRGLVKRHEQYLTQYISKQIHSCKVSGLTRRMTVITKQGLVVLATLRNEKDKTVNDSRFVESKKEVAEKAIEASTPNLSAELLNDPFIQLRLKQLQQDKRMDTFEQKLEEVKVLAVEAPPTDLVTSQREFLNDRLRYYCQQTEMSHSYIWKKLHAYMCKESINDYKFGDFKPAIRYLKELYKSSHLDWN